MTNEQTAADRIRKFIDEYKKMRGLHPEMVYEIHAGNDHRHAAITIADLEALLAQPEPEGVTDEEWEALKDRLLDRHKTVGYQGEVFIYDRDFDVALDDVRQELARWGRPAIKPVPTTH